MENLDDNFFESNLTELTGRFEKMVAEGQALFYEVDDLEDLLEHYMMQNQFDLAQKVIETAHEQYPYNKQLSIKEAELLSFSDKHNEALAILEDVENLEGFNPDFHITKASILSQCGKYQNAVDSLNRALACASDEHEVIYMNMALEYINLENYTAAIDLLKKTLALNYENEDPLYELSYCFELTQQHHEAVAYFNKVIDQTPYNSHAWFNLATSYQAAGDMEKALVAFDYCIVIDEEFQAAYYNKAGVLMRLSRFEEAIDLYKRSLSFEMLDSLIYFYIGDCYDNLSDHKNALLYFEKSLKKDDCLAESWIGASSSLDMLNRELESLEYAKRAIDIDNENGDYWCYLAGLQAKYDLPDDAMASYEKAIGCGYVLEDVWEEYAQLALTLREAETAESAIERGLDIHPENLLLQLYKSISLYRKKEEDEAFEMLVRLLMKDPQLIEEFILFYPKGIERQEIQFLIESMKQ